MSRLAKVFEIFIASPSDASEERDIVCRLVVEWNAIHYHSSSAIMHAVHWESHSHPQLGDRPQSIINKKLLVSADLVVAVFRGRLGQETGKYQSGTIEEIEEARAANIPVLMYFYTGEPFRVRVDFVSRVLGLAVPQNEADYLKACAEFAVVQRCRAHYERQGIVGAYGSVQEFEPLLRQQLYRAISEILSPASGTPGRSTV